MNAQSLLLARRPSAGDEDRDETDDDDDDEKEEEDNPDRFPSKEKDEDEEDDGREKDRKEYRAKTCNDCNRQFCMELNLPICKGAGMEDVFTTCFRTFFMSKQSLGTPSAVSIGVSFPDFETLGVPLEDHADGQVLPQNEIRGRTRPWSSFSSLPR